MCSYQDCSQDESVSIGNRIMKPVLILFGQNVFDKTQG